MSDQGDGKGDQGGAPGTQPPGGTTPPVPPGDTNQAPRQTNDQQRTGQGHTPSDDAGDERRKRIAAEKAQRDLRDEVATLLAKLDGKSGIETTLEQEKALRAQADQRALAYEVAAEKGLPLAMAKRLIGVTKAELEDDADRLADALKPPAGSGQGLRRDSVSAPPNGDRTGEYTKEQLLRIMAKQE